MNLRNIGLGLLAAGLLVVLVAFRQDAAPEGTYNLGLLQTQMMVLHTGLVIALGGGIAAAVGAVVRRMEQAGLLPPAGVRPTLGTNREGDGA